MMKRRNLSNGIFEMSTGYRKSEISGPCRRCLMITKRVCSSCRMAFYCSIQHQNEDDTHEKPCSPPLFMEVEGKGSAIRFSLVARKDIGVGQEIFREYPMAVGAKDNIKKTNQVPTCLGCCATLSIRMREPTSDRKKCSKCKWPVCSSTCESSYGHAALECRYFTKHNIVYPDKIESFKLRYLLYKGVYVLRALLFREEHPEEFETFMKLSARTSPESKNLANTHDKLVLRLLKETLKVGLLSENRNGLTEEDLTDIINHLCCYGFSRTVFNSRRQQCGSVDAVYFNGAKMARSCTPNVSWTIGPAPDFVFQAVAAKNIKKKEELSLPYNTHLYQEALYKRQAHISNYWGVKCSCSRCSDPSEMGSFFSGVKCSQCPEGYLLPTCSKTSKFYMCSNEECSAKCKASEVNQKVTTIERLVTADMENSANISAQEIKQKIQQLKAEGYLHPNHSVIYKLVWEVVKKEIYDLHKFDWNSLISFIDHCEYLLQIEEKLCPTFSQGRASLYFFLGRAFFYQYGIFKTMNVSRKEQGIILDKIMDLYDEARKFFKKCDDENGASKVIHMDMQEVVSIINALK